MQRLGQPPDIVERRLGDLADLSKLGSQRRSLGRVTAGAAQHRSHRRQNLAEFVVELAGDLAQRGFTRGDHLPGDLAPLVRQQGQPCEERPVRANQIQAGQRDRDEGGGEKQVHLALDLVVDFLDTGGRRLLGFVVLSEQARHARAERSLPRLQREPDLRARLRVLPACRESKDAIRGIPELRQRALEVRPLLGRPARNGDLLLAAQRGIEVGADTLKLRRPGRQRVRLVAVEHVAHRQAELVQVVLHAEQLERVLAAAVDQLRLQHPQAGDLPRHVPGIGHHGRERDDQPQQQRRGRRSALRSSPVVHVTTPRADGLSTASRSGPWSGAPHPVPAGGSRSGRGDAGCASRTG